MQEMAKKAKAEGVVALPETAGLTVGINPFNPSEVKNLKEGFTKMMKQTGWTTGDDAEWERRFEDVAREAGLLKRGNELLLQRSLRSNPERFMEFADLDWNQRLGIVARGVAQRYRELYDNGFPEDVIRAYIRDYADKEAQSQRILHEARFGAENLREAESIVKTRKSINLASKADTTKKE